MKKGAWYYEMQILMFVIMWKHDMLHQPNRARDGFSMGRLYIWTDSAWLLHGFGRKLKRAWDFIYPFFTRPLIRVWYSIKETIFKIQLFCTSLYAYLQLYQAGMVITHAHLGEMHDFEIYRFFWKGGMMRAVPDIDKVYDEFFTMHNGTTEKLP